MVIITFTQPVGYILIVRFKFFNSNIFFQGHLIWRIDNFQARMKEAKEKDAVLTSPLFRTSKYGYTLKVKYFFNREVYGETINKL